MFLCDGQHVSGDIWGLRVITSRHIYFRLSVSVCLGLGFPPFSEIIFNKRQRAGMNLLHPAVGVACR